MSRKYQDEGWEIETASGILRLLFGGFRWR
jgi:hypothetical protein